MDTLKELEHRVNLDAEALGFQRAFPAIGPEAVRGIEINYLDFLRHSVPHPPRRGAEAFGDSGGG